MIMVRVIIIIIIMYMRTIVSWHKHNWAQSSLGTNVSRDKRVRAHSYDTKIGSLLCTDS